MVDFGYCEVWPPELKEAERQRYHVCCLIRCLEAKLERIEPFSDEFDKTIEALDLARADLYLVAMRVNSLNYRIAQNEISSNA